MPWNEHVGVGIVVISSIISHRNIYNITNDLMSSEICEFHLTTYQWRNAEARSMSHAHNKKCFLQVLHILDLRTSLYPWVHIQGARKMRKWQSQQRIEPLHSPNKICDNAATSNWTWMWTLPGQGRRISFQDGTTSCASKKPRRSHHCIPPCQLKWSLVSTCQNCCFQRTISQYSITARTKQTRLGKLLLDWHNMWHCASVAKA